MNEEQEKIKKELSFIVEELSDLAKLVKKDYEDNPTDISGSVVQIHEDSPYMNENLPDKGWHRVLTKLPLNRVKKSLKKRK